MDSNSWLLDEISINLNRWGENKDKYEGRISFRNGANETFSFNIDQSQAQVFLSLIAGQVCRSADELGKRISESISSNCNVEM